MFNFLPPLKELRSAIISLGLVLATAIIGIIWLSIGFYNGLVALIGPLWGPFALGGICFIPLIGFMIHQAKTPKPQPQATAQPFMAGDSAVSQIARIIETVSERSVLLGAVAATLAGFLATRFPMMLSLFAQIVTAYAEDMKRHDAKKTAKTADGTEPASKAEPKLKRRSKPSTTD